MEDRKMEDRRIILEVLDRYEGQLALGIYPSELFAVLGACDDLNELLDVLAPVTKSLYTARGQSLSPGFREDIERVIAQSEEARDDNGPDYHVARFVKANLVFRPPNGGELVEQQVEENRRKLSDYRRQLEALGV